MYSKLKAIILFLGLFFLLFPPHILISGGTLKTVYIFIFVPSLFGAFHYLTTSNTSNLIKVTLVLMAIAFIYFSIISGLICFIDTSVLGEITTGLILLFSCYFYVRLYYRFYTDTYVNRLFIDLNRAGVVQAVIVIATLVSKGFKDFLYSFIGVTETSARYLYGEVAVQRFQGIAPSGFSFLSTTHALLFVCGIWGFYTRNKKYSIVGVLFFTFGQLAILVSILLIGRTGLVVIIIFSILLIIYSLQSAVLHNNRPSKINTSNTLKVFFCLLSTIFVLAISFDFSTYEKNIDFAFETVINYYKYRELDRTTNGVINEHYIFPKTADEIVFGTGNFGRSEQLPYIESDVGYILFLHGSGILGIIIGFSFYGVGLFYSYKYRKLNNYLSLFIAIYLVMFSIVNLKDYYYISHVGYTQIYFIMLCALAKSIDLYRNKLSEYQPVVKKLS